VRRRRADATRINPPTVKRWTRFDLGVRCVPAQPTVTRLRSDHASEQQGAIMQGDPDVLRLLNEQLTSELTAINQYFLHSKMQENWGFTEVAGHTRAESFDEMRHAEAITDLKAFFGAADDADLQHRLGRMVASTSAFGANENIDTVPTSRYVLKTPFET
jgi:hypothetical protein